MAAKQRQVRRVRRPISRQPGARGRREVRQRHPDSQLPRGRHDPGHRPPDRQPPRLVRVSHLSGERPQGEGHPEVPGRARADEARREGHQVLRAQGQVQRLLQLQRPAAAGADLQAVRHAVEVQNR